MHELALAESVVSIALRHAAGRRVHRVHLKVGHLRQVVPSALEFAFELLTPGTELEGATLQMEPVAAAGACRRCGAESQLDGFPFACARCGSLELNVIRGEELLVEELELEESMATMGGRGHGD
jgi:hydrogenase nickel incorporation protein HypA/HybF